MSDGYVKSEVSNGVATVTFHHPKSNSLPGHILRAMADAITSCGRDTSVRVIVLRSEGDKAFCAGASFDELVSINDAETGLAFFSGFAHVINAIRKAPVLVIGRIHAHTVGGGVGLACAVAPVGHGYKFQRTDLEGEPIIDADADLVVSTERGTTLGKGDVTVNTTEHVLSALYALGVDNCLLQISGPELPIMDGSALPFVHAIESVGLEEQNAPRNWYVLKEPIWFETQERGPPAIAEAMVDKNHDTIEGLNKKGEILTLTSEMALKHGYCDHIVASITSALRILNLENARVERIEPTSAEWIARYLTNPQISVILFTVGFWCLVLEFFVAGFGILGWAGIVCLALFFGGHLFAYMAGLEALILFVVGMVLLLIEAFIIPGFGITGVSGIIAVCFSIVMVFGGIYSALTAIASIITYSVIITGLVYWWGPKLRVFDRFVLKEEMAPEQGFVATEANVYDHLLNLEGIATSPCRPSGKVQIGDERYDAVSDGDFIEKGARVVVRKVEGQKIVVRQVVG